MSWKLPYCYKTDVAEMTNNLPRQVSDICPMGHFKLDRKIRKSVIDNT